MDEPHFLEETRNWEHPPWYGNVQCEEKATQIFLENQQRLFHNLMTRSGCRSDEWFLVHVPDTSYSAITLNQESNFARREKNHCQFHCNTLTSPELHVRFWMSSKSAASMFFGISMGQEICLILGRGFTQFILWEEKLADGYMWWRLTRKQLTSRPDHFMARTLDEIEEMRQHSCTEKYLSLFSFVSRPFAQAHDFGRSSRRAPRLPAPSTSKKPSQRPRRSTPAVSSSPSTSSRSWLRKAQWTGAWKMWQTARTTGPCQTRQLSRSWLTCCQLRRLHLQWPIWSAASHCALCTAPDHVESCRKCSTHHHITICCCHTCPLSRVWCLPVVSRVRCLRSVCPAQDSQIYKKLGWREERWPQMVSTQGDFCPHACVHGGQPTMILPMPFSIKSVTRVMSVMSVMSVIFLQPHSFRIY